MQHHKRVEIEPFTPHWTLTNPHAQTLAGSFLRPDMGALFRRERLSTPDGDFIDLDYVDFPFATWEQLGEDAPIVLHIHGLGGNAQSNLAQQVYYTLSQRGVRCVGMNLRSASGETNLTARKYHGGSSDDLQFVHETLHARYSNVPIALIGISLGANILLKYLGEQGEQLQDSVAAAVAISPPFDFMKGKYIMSRGLGLGYTQQLLRGIRADLMQHPERYEGLQGVQLDKALGARTLHEFDDYFTAPVHGFENHLDYYMTVASKNYIHNVRIPTLILRAVDDPFFDPTDIPYALIQRNPFLYAGIVEHGGHVGFVEGSAYGGQHQFWAERQTANFLSWVI